MECSCNWDYRALINELTIGMEQAKQLKLHLSSTSSGVQDLFLQRILSSFENGLLILKWANSGAQSQPSQPPVSGGIESSISIDNSRRSENLNPEHPNGRPEASKKRKTLPTRTEQVRINPENGLEGPADDGYSWRKYGQKDILGAKYPRSYYRCTYRHVQNCWATKQVQRSDDDPTVFDITYKGEHACYQATNNQVALPKSQEKKEITHSNDQNNHQSQQPNEMLINFRANLRVNTEEQENNTINPFAFPSTFTYTEGDDQFCPTSELADETFFGTYSSAFVSPTTPESNYFSTSNGYINSLGGTSNLQHSESDLTDIVSANASATNSPNAGLEFLTNPLNLDPDFPFSMSAFFT